MRGWWREGEWWQGAVRRAGRKEVVMFHYEVVMLEMTFSVVEKTFLLYSQDFLLVPEERKEVKMNTGPAGEMKPDQWWERMNFLEVVKMVSTA